MRVSIVALVASLLCAAPAFALEDEDQVACAQSLPLSTALVEAAGGANMSYVAGHEDGTAFLTGSVHHGGELEGYEDVAGAVVFARDVNGAWRGVLPYNGESNIAMYRGPNGALMLATMWMSEGPGSAWTIVQTNDRFVTATCTRVAFPTDLNQPSWANEFLELIDFDMDARGRGELIGLARLERNGAETTRYYSIRTRDGGATWQSPRRISRQREARGGLYTPIEELPASAGLISELNLEAEPIEDQNDRAIAITGQTN